MSDYFLQILNFEVRVFFFRSVALLIDAVFSGGVPAGHSCEVSMQGMG